MVPGFVRQGLLLQPAPNFKLVLAKVLSKLGREGDTSSSVSPSSFI
jgi:hypothetical protein